MTENTRIVEHATCTFCGCVCDDMKLTVDLDTHRITKAENACVLGRAWFAEHASPLIRGARGFVYLREMDMQEFRQTARSLRRAAEDF